MISTVPFHRRVPGRLTERPSDASSGRVMAAAVTGTVTVVLPVNVLGAVATMVRDDIGFGKGALGVLFAMYHGSGMLASIPGGDLSERLGPRRSMVLAAAMSSAAALAIGVLAREWWHLAVAVVLAGVANGVGQPSASLALSRGVRLARQGIAFGLKQASIPAAGILAGLAVPAFGLTVGWRWAFVVIALMFVAVVVITPNVRFVRAPRVPRDALPADTRDRPPMSLIVPFALGSAASMTIPAFLAETVVDAGHSAALAGVVLAAGSAVGLISRLIVGTIADRRGRGHLQLVSMLMAGGAVGCVVLGFASEHTTALLIGVFVTYAAAMGWAGLMMMAIVQMFPTRPGAAAGRAQAGASVGPLVGPLLFGLIASSHGFGAAWSLVALFGALGAILTFTHVRGMDRSNFATAATTDGGTA